MSGGRSPASRVDASGTCGGGTRTVSTTSWRAATGASPSVTSRCVTIRISADPFREGENMIGIAHHHRLQAVLLGAFLPAAVAVGELRAQQKASDFLHEISVPEEEAIARRVLASPAVARAMEYIRGAEAETVREWLQLCNAYGPSGDEIYRANLLHKLMRMYGLENVHIDDQRNVIGIRR